ncbi:TPA: YopX family protein [Streptococcus suis]
MIPKFRVWDTVKKAMSEVQAIVYTEERVYPIYSKTTRRYIPFSEAILMQPTGLFDANGKEIFEGDVFTYLDDDNNPIYENIVVKFGQHKNMDTIYERGPVYIGLYVEVQKGTATLEIDSMYNDCEGRLTIIGNIYENPELLEVLND